MEQPIRIALVSGSFPPDMCGVGDYSHTLAQAMEAAGVSVSPVIERNWALHKLRSISQRVKKSGANLLHLQYPTLTYHASLVPHLLPILVSMPTLVTLHEFKYAHPLRKIAAVLFGFRARKIIFPNREDLASFCRWYPWFRRKCTLIELGSNIPVIAGKFARGREVVYFGMIRPEKGIEEFLEAARLSRGGRYKFRLIGGLDVNNPDYSQTVIQQAQEFGVTVNANLPSAAISELLQVAKYAYLPFPGGPTERRTSLLAVLEHGCVVLTSKAPSSSEFSKVVMEVDNPSALSDALSFLDDHEDLVTRKQLAAVQLMGKHNWQEIAQNYITLLRGILETGCESR